MSRVILPVLAALVLVTASLIPGDAYARGGGGGRGGGGFHGGGVRAGGFHGGAVRAGGFHRGGAVYAGRGYRVASRPGYGYGYRGYGYRRYGYGAAAVVGGAALYGAYNNSCFYDAYGQYICPEQYPYYRY